MLLPVLEKEAGVCFEADVIISIQNYWRQGTACLQKQNHVNSSSFPGLTQIAFVVILPKIIWTL